MKKSLILTLLVLLVSVSAHGGGYAPVAGNSASKRSVAVPPTEPSFTLIDVPTTGMVIIKQSEWNALQQYFTAFDRYANDVEAELAQMKKKPGESRPNDPRMNLNTATAKDLPPAVAKVSKDTYMLMSAENRTNLNKNLEAMRNYIRSTQAMF